MVCSQNLAVDQASMCHREPGPCLWSWQMTYCCFGTHETSHEMLRKYICAERCDDDSRSIALSYHDSRRI